MNNFKGLINKNIAMPIVVGVVMVVCNLLGGCVLRKEWTKGQYKSRHNSSFVSSYTIKHHYALDPKQLQEMPFDGPLTIGNFDMFYQQGLMEQAVCVAKQLGSIVAILEHRLKLDVPFELRVYLIRRDYIPQNITVQFEEDKSFSLPLFIANDNESCQTILSENPFYPYLFVHEIVEAALISPQREFPVLLDFCSFHGFVKIANHTRWFRDGLAGYAQYMIHKELSSNEGLIESKYFLLHKEMVPQHPFSSLYKVKNNLFLWTQFDSDTKDQVYYNASWGLFLLIENKFGKDSAGRIINNLNKSDYLDGKTLIEIINETFCIDIKRMVRDFYWPDIGLEIVYLTPAFAKNRNLSVLQGGFLKNVKKDSLADKVGLEEGDIIIAVNDQRIESNLDFEIALLRSMQKKRAHITVDRLGIQKVLILELGHVEATSRPLEPAEKNRKKGWRL